MDRNMLIDAVRRYEQANFVVNRRLNALIRGMMPEEMTVDQFATLRYIRERQRVTSSELAEIFCVGKSSITAIIARLSDKQLIERAQDDKDRRVTYLTLTDRGDQLAGQFEEKLYELLSELLVHFNVQEGLNFIATFEKLAHILSVNGRD